MLVDRQTDTVITILGLSYCRRSSYMYTNVKLKYRLRRSEIESHCLRDAFGLATVRQVASRRRADERQLLRHRCDVL